MSEQDKQYTNSCKDFRVRDDEDFGYYFYPERSGGTVTFSWWQKLFNRTVALKDIHRARCEENVAQLLEEEPAVKLMKSALEKNGCPIKLERHFSCEHCIRLMKGGFDPTTNQIVLCSNNNTSPKEVQKTLLHEMIHMFDHCRAHVDFSNLKHLACTEVRAANLTGCTMWDAAQRDLIGPFKFANQHKECVKSSAILSIRMVRNVSEEEARQVVDEVFDQCYNDLEPLGARLRSYKDNYRSFLRGKWMGYT